MVQLGGKQNFSGKRANINKEREERAEKQI